LEQNNQGWQGAEKSDQVRKGAPMKETQQLSSKRSKKSNALVLLLLDIQHYGTLAAQVFFGLWLAPLGYLAYKSGLFPKVLGVILVAATVSYLLDVLAAFLVPDFATQIHPFLIIVPAIAEIWMVLYLLVKGVRVPAQDAPRQLGVVPAPGQAG